MRSWDTPLPCLVANSSTRRTNELLGWLNFISQIEFHLLREARARILLDSLMCRLVLQIFGRDLREGAPRGIHQWFSVTRNWQFFHTILLLFEAHSGDLKHLLVSTNWILWLGFNSQMCSGLDTVTYVKLLLKWNCNKWLKAFYSP